MNKLIVWLCIIAAGGFAALASSCDWNAQKTMVTAPPKLVVNHNPGTLALITEREIVHEVQPSSGQKPVEVYFNKHGLAVAYVVNSEKASHVVFKNKAGRDVSGVEYVTISPDGQHIAYSALIDGKRHMIVDDREGPSHDDIHDPEFSPDSMHVVYKAKVGAMWMVVLNGKSGIRSTSFYDSPRFSKDGSKILIIENAPERKRPRLLIGNLSLKIHAERELSGKVFLYNADATNLAMIAESNGRKHVLVVNVETGEMILAGPEYDEISQLVFGSDGKTVAYIASRAGKQFLLLNENEHAMPEGVPVELPVISPDQKRVGFLMVSDGKVYMHTAFDKASHRERSYDNIENLVYSPDGQRYAYAAGKGAKVCIAVNGKEGAWFDKVVSPAFSPDGRFLVYRARQDGRRFVVVADRNGTVIRKHAPHEMVFPVVFTEDGTSVAYGVKDGNELVWKVEKLK